MHDKIIVKESAAPAQAGSAVASVLLVVGALPALMAVLGTRDVVKIVAYISSLEFAPVLGILTVAGTVLWRQLKTRWSHQEKVALADDASIGVVK